MTSTWIIPFLVLGTMASRIIAQEFNFVMPDHTVTNEGQIGPLIINISRTELLNQEANVTLVAYELSNNNQKEWEIPVFFLVDESFRELPLGVINDDIHDPNRLYIFMLSNPSPGYAIGARSSAVVSYIDNDGPPLFDCRADDVCAAGSCNLFTGHCVCPPGLAYSDCSLNLNALDVPSSVCSAITCGIGGVCVIDNTDVRGARCACQPGYGGADCTRSDRYDVMCYRNGMCLNVHPPSTYVGSRAIRGKDGLDSCMLKDVTADAIRDNSLPDHWSGSFICLADEDPICGDADVSIRANGFSSYSRQVHIRLTNEFILRRDILFTGRCIYDNNGVLYVTKTVDPATGLIPITRNDTVESTAIYLVNKDTGVRYEQSVFGVGDEICFALEVTAGFSSLRINNVIADDGLATPATHELLRNGCPVPGIVDLVTAVPYRPTASDKKTLFFCFAAFSFATSQEIGLKFETTVCPVSDTLCTQYSCEGETSFGRKKRDIQTSNTILTTKIRVGSMQTPIRPIGEEATVEECVISRAIIVALSILAVVCLMLLFATILLVIRSTRSRDKFHE